MKKRIAWVTLTLWCAIASSGTFLSGDELYEKMKSPAEDQKKYALGFVVAVHDLGDTKIFCSPADVTAGQVFNLIQLHLAETPRSRHIPAASIVTFILAASWPCDPDAKGPQL
ncbi:MAG: Rap1a/Tai family immunity protein [bacterium]